MPPRCATVTGSCSRTAPPCASPASLSRWSRSPRRRRPCSRGSPGTSAIATPTCRSWATPCASAATTCSRTCCAAWARGSRRSRRRSTRSRELTGTVTITAMATKRPPRPADDGLDGPALYRLMAWLSPAYPVGTFSYSGGIEWAVEAGDISDAATLREWLAVVIADGGGFCDAIFLAHAHRAATARDDAALRAVAELACAFPPSKERHLETTAQGRAFLDTTRAAWPTPALDGLEAVLNAYLQAIAANLVSAGVRLIPLGQTDGQRVLAALEPLVRATAARALATPLDEVGAGSFRADLASMRHETQYTRLFRS